MLIGVPKEIKNHEYRVGLAPSSVRELVNHSHSVQIQAGAGLGIGMSDEDYVAAGATIIATAEEIFAKCDMIVKVKEPQPSEYDLIRDEQIVFTYLHLAADEQQTNALIKSKCIAIAYETCLKEADQAGIETLHHITHLLIHGILHLLGYDHETDSDAEMMETLEIDLLNSMGIGNPYKDV